MADVRDLLKPLAPRTQRHHLVECITTEESPLRLTVFDEENTTLCSPNLERLVMCCHQASHKG